MPTQTTPSPSSSMCRDLPPAKGSHLRPPSDTGVGILRLISEQFAIQVDQLARFLDRSESETLGHVEELRACAFVEVGQFAVDESPWVWLRVRGAKLLGTVAASARAPATKSLAHRRAINEIRLELGDRAPRGRWIPERRLRAERCQDEFIPDAVFEINGERHAIEVELNRKPRSKLRQIVAQHSRRYDAVVYFCSPRTGPLLAWLSATAEFPKLVVRDLGPSRAAARSRAKTTSPLPVEAAASRRREAVEDRRRALLAEMVAAVAEVGYQEARVRDICSRAGVSHATFNRIFKNKEDCYRAAHCGAAPPIARPEVAAAVKRLLGGEHRPPPVAFSALHPGRSDWSREFVVDNQRSRILAAAADVLVEVGYAEASVEKVCARARLSRHTFYQLFDCLEDCIVFAGGGVVDRDRQKSGKTAAAAGLHKAVRHESMYSTRVKKRRSLRSASPAPDRPRPKPQPSISAPWQSFLVPLLLEQGAIPVDQLDRFLTPIEDVPERPAQALDQAGFIHRRRFLAGEPEWVWLRRSAVRLVPAGPRHFVPTLGGLARLRAINEIRLHLDSPDAGLCWTGWRRLRRELPARGSCRRRIAVVEVGGERHAIHLQLTFRGRDDLEDLLDHSYDAAVCFCTPGARGRLEALIEGHYLPKLIIRDLPGGDPRKRQWQPVVSRPEASDARPDGSSVCA